MKKFFITSFMVMAVLFGIAAADYYDPSLKDKKNMSVDEQVIQILEQKEQQEQQEQQAEQAEQTEHVEEQELTTPLSKYSVYYSLDNFPKYKEEAEDRVKELMNNGLSEEEACDIALDELSTKIHDLSMDFIHKNPSIELEQYMVEYLKYIEPTQH